MVMPPICTYTLHDLCISAFPPCGVMEIHEYVREIDMAEMLAQ